MDINLIGIIASVVINIILLFLLLSKNNLLKKHLVDLDEKNIELERYRVIKDVRAEARKLEVASQDTLKSLNEAHDKIKDDTSTLKANYTKNMTIYKHLLEEIEITSDKLDYSNMGIYEPHFDFETSEEFKKTITDMKEVQKGLIQQKLAVVCNTEWTLEGSKAKGKAMITKGVKLTLRAFNGECDSAIAKVKWNNINAMEKRIEKSFEMINKLNVTNNIIIDDMYLKCKLDELWLTHEYREKQHDEKEEQKAIREQMREEEKAQKEFEKAQKEAEKEEANYQKALDKARKELSNANHEELSELESKIKQLEEQLTEAEAKKQRALSQAQLTRSGHVYVISNIGSFGNDIYKIGMTRRLEPLDRVKELGDASVPFIFDIHAMIYSEDAPTLEKKLHKVFEKNRVNMINNRKEFFNVSLEEIEKEVHNNYAEIEFTKIAEAKDYRESLSMKEQDNASNTLDDIIEQKFPLEL